MGCMTRFTYGMQHPYYAAVMTVLFIALSIYQIVQNADSMRRLDEIADDYNTVVANWKGSPVTAVETVATNTACPTDYQTMTFKEPQQTWPGSDEGPCACPSSTYQTYSYYQAGGNSLLQCPADGATVSVAIDSHCYTGNNVKYCPTYYDTSTNTTKIVCGTAQILPTQTSTSGGACNSNQTTKNCMTDTSLPAVTMDIWRGMKVCYKPQGDGVLYDVSGTHASLRPRPSGGSCPSGWKVCGNAQSDDDRKTCTQTANACPLTAIQVFSSTTATGYTASEWEGTKSLSGTYILAYRTNGLDELPLVGDATMNSVPAYNMQTIMGGADDLPCVGTSDKTKKWSTGSSSNGATGTNNYDNGGCSSADTRFVRADSTTETSVLTENLASTTHTPCGTVTTTYFDIGNTGSSSTNTVLCTSGDSICNAVSQRTSCQKAGMYQSGSNTIQLLYRRQIYWSSTCQDDSSSQEDQVLKVSDPVSQLQDTQRAQFYVNLFANIICTWILPILVLLNICGVDLPCFNGDGADENKKIKCYAAGFDGCFFIGKEICVIIAFVLTLQYKDWFSTTADGGCSDPRTNETFESLSDTLQAIYSNNLQVLIVDIFMGLYKVYGCCTLKGDKAYTDYCEYEAAQDQAKALDEASEIDMGDKPGAMPEKSEGAA